MEKEKNLIRSCNWYNPLTAITEKGEAFELDNIIIYSENGALIETGRGWFDHGNNSIKEDEGLTITPAIKRKTKIDFNCKQNYIVRSEEKSYRIDRRYTLYLYYKNVNYKYEGLTLDNLFLNLNYNILNGEIKSYIVVGDRDRKSYKIKYDDELQQAFKDVSSYNFDYSGEKLLKAIETIKKQYKKFVAAKEYEKKLTVADYKELVRELAVEYLENNQKLEGVKND